MLRSYYLSQSLPQTILRLFCFQGVWELPFEPEFASIYSDIVLFPWCWRATIWARVCLYSDIVLFPGCWGASIWAEFASIYSDIVLFPGCWGATIWARVCLNLFWYCFVSRALGNYHLSQSLPQSILILFCFQGVGELPFEPENVSIYSDIFFVSRVLRSYHLSQSSPQSVLILFCFQGVRELPFEPEFTSICSDIVLFPGC